MVLLAQFALVARWSLVVTEHMRAQDPGAAETTGHFQHVGH